jgi:hypothetical protein
MTKGTYWKLLGRLLKAPRENPKILDKRKKLWYNKIRKEGIRMMEFFRNDHLRVGKTKRIRALSPLWFAVRIGQALISILISYVFIVSLWILLG